MKKKLIRSMLLLALISVTLAFGLVMPRLHQAFEQRAFEEMGSTSAVLAEAMEASEDRIALLEQLRRDVPRLRLTWIDTAGDVLFDSEVSQTTGMENHAEREEILEALRTGSGEARRKSSSLDKNTYYFARKLADGTVIRVAKTERSVTAEVLSLLPAIVLVILLVIGIAFLYAGWVTKRLIRPINQLDLEHPEENDVDEELAPLLARMREQNKHIAEQFRESGEAAQTIYAMMENMAEGLIILSAQERIVSINRSAAAMLESSMEALLGLHYIAAYRDLDFQRSIAQALAGYRQESILRMSGRTIQMIADPVLIDGQPHGAVVLFLDITEREAAEATRREFSANVSHELKTPLTTIAGYAEMMQSGMADSMDTTALSGKILGESKRLLSLIDDIMKLSKLDERTGQAEYLPVDLYAIAQSVMDRMMPVAAARGLTLSLHGEAQVVMGSPVLLEEMLQNLIDNAIRYNRTGGSVEVSLAAEGGDVILRVTDTGIGIDPVHQVRIFERFYRVDKSHSRATGGTGLGLSIVKHSAQVQGGMVSVESQPGEGTTMVVQLPRYEPETESDHAE